ncbi:conserved phage C-terminal domain-containing protein [Streptococcus pluranimalium]|uniref:conserved phage C-terminal domain-containing protein n=1 Tax=Streptococcus pluranimalium TaxID=82348 RepID=UPI002A76A2C2|nr:conserved phage C-terminal domain-containing protein [Streptococcus pluranimalium]
MIKKNEVTGFLAFFKFPKPFIYDEKYKTLSNNAKMLYMLLFDRLELSLKNGWHDKEGNVFQYYTNDQLMIDLNCNSNKTIVKIKKELKDAGLMTEVRQGVNLPNRIYIEALSGSVENTLQEVQKIHDGSVENTLQEVQKIHTIKTENTKTESNNNINTSVKEIIDYLNERAGTKFKASTQTTQKLIKSRMKEGFGVADFKHVIDVKVTEWGNTDFAKFLRPSTLFGNKFENYVNQTLTKKQTNSFTSAVDERLGF